VISRSYYIGVTKTFRKHLLSPLIGVLLLEKQEAINYFFSISCHILSKEV